MFVLLLPLFFATTRVHRVTALSRLQALSSHHKSVEEAYTSASPTHSHEIRLQNATRVVAPDNTSKTLDLAPVNYYDAFAHIFWGTSAMKLSLLVGFLLALGILIFELMHKRVAQVDRGVPFASLEEGRVERSHDSAGPIRGAFSLWSRYVRQNLEVFMLCIAITGMLIALLQYANTKLVSWSNDFWNKIEKWGTSENAGGKVAELNMLLVQFLFFAFLAVFGSAYRSYVMSMFQIHAREDITHRYSAQWLDKYAYYRLELHRNGHSGTDADNPDQRIQEDVNLFVSNSLNLVVDGISSLAQFVIFSGTVYNYSPNRFLGFDGVQVPGWLLWLSIFYAVVATASIHYVSRRLELLSYVMQRAEADFRWELTSVRRYAGEIALSGSEDAHDARLRDRFEMVRRCFWETMFVQKRYSLVAMFFMQSESIFAFVLLGPSFLKGDIDLGGLMAAARAMGLLSSSLMWFGSNYPSIVDWRASTDRLVRFEEGMLRRIQENCGIKVQASCTDVVRCEHLKVWAPTPQDFNTHTLLFGDLSLKIEGGQRILLAGPSGAGKSSLLRSLAGIWPFAEGEVYLPDAPGTSLFFSSEVYAPSGTLRDVVMYPKTKCTDDEEIRSALQLVGLGHLLDDSLEQVREWSLCLSSGQKARLSFARMILHKPKFAAFDEPLAHLEEECHSKILTSAFAALPPDSSVLVISHQLNGNVTKLFTSRFDVDVDGKRLLVR